MSARQQQRNSNMEALKKLITTWNNLTGGELYLGGMAGHDYIIDNAVGPRFVIGSLDYVRGYLAGRVCSLSDRRQTT